MIGPARFTYTLTAPPMSLNNIFINVPGKGRMKSAPYKRWRQAAGWELAEQRRRYGAEAIRAPIGVQILLPRAIRGDVDNRAKAALDVLKDAGVISDDRICDPVTIGRADVQKTTIHITVRGVA